MATYKRQLWTSGYTYRQRCPYCGTVTDYTDRQLGYRSWYPNGFIYCSRCRKPLRHNEIFAIKPDGTPVYATQAEADAAIHQGYYSVVGAPVAGPGDASYAPPAPAAPYAPPAAPATAAPAPAPAATVGNDVCPDCGKPYVKGVDHFCSNCGKKLD